MVFTAEMEADLLQLYEQFGPAIETKSRCANVNSARNNAWLEIVKSLNAKYPTKHVTIDQVKTKIQIFTSDSRKYDRKNLCKVLFYFKRDIS
jgi:hypothetical protein